MGVQTSYHKPPHLSRWCSLAVLFAWLLAACGAAQETTAPLESPQPAVTVTLPATSTPESSPTPVTGVVVLLAPQGADPLQVQALQPVIQDLASQAGLRFQPRAELSPLELEHVKIVVALPPAANLADLAAAAPATQFLALGIPGLQASDNLSVIAASTRMDQAAFLAGFMAAAITDEWRIGVIGESGSASGKAALNGFANGEAYFCGLCLSGYPPFPAGGYPILLVLPANPGPADWQGVLNELRSWQVKTVFVHPAVAVERLLDELAQADISFILLHTPPQAVQSNLVAILGTSDGVQAVPEVWASMLQGQGGQQVDLPLSITYSNPERLSPGRQRLAENLLVDLLTGMVDTGVDPTSGELIAR